MLCTSCAIPDRCSYAGCARDTAWLTETHSGLSLPGAGNLGGVSAPDALRSPAAFSSPNTAPSVGAPCAALAGIVQRLPCVTSLTAAGVAPAAPAVLLGEA